MCDSLGSKKPGQIVYTTPEEEKGTVVYASTETVSSSKPKVDEREALYATPMKKKDRDALAAAEAAAAGESPCCFVVCPVRTTPLVRVRVVITVDNV